MVFTAIIWAHQSNLNSLTLVAALAAVVGVVGGILRILEKLVSEFSKTNESKLKHSEDLIKEVFEHIAINGYVDYKNDEIIESPVKWSESDREYQAVQHLKTGYSEIYHEYLFAQECAEILIKDIVKKFQQYRRIVEQKLTEAQIQLPASDKFVDFKTKRYNKKFVKNRLFDEVRTGKFTDIVISGFESSSLVWDVTNFAYGNTDSLEHLKNVIEKIRKDKEIIDIITEIESKKIQLRNNTALDRFNIRKKEIIEQVRIKHKPLYGKCDDNRFF